MGVPCTIKLLFDVVTKKRYTLLYLTPLRGRGAILVTKTSWETMVLEKKLVTLSSVIMAIAPGAVSFFASL